MKSLTKRVSNIAKMLKLEKKEKSSRVNFERFLDMSSEVRRSDLHWKNPLTNHLIGYKRAYDLDLIRKTACGILNPKTRRLVSVSRARLLGLIPA